MSSKNSIETITDSIDSMDWRDVFLLRTGAPLQVERPSVGKIGARRRKRLKQRETVGRVYRGLLTRLNSLELGIVQPVPLREGAENAVQCVASIFLQNVGEASCRRSYFGGAGALEEVETAFEYNYLRTWVWLDPERVSLPARGLAASANVIPILPELLQERYLSRGQLLRDNNQQEKCKRPFCGIQGGDYGSLIEWLKKAALEELVRGRPKVIKGVFAVPKSEQGKQRLIIDARNANLEFFEPPNVELPNLGHLARLYLAKRQTLNVGKYDMDNQYHRMHLPQCLHEHFGLPEVYRDGQKLYPVMKSMPMGWLHSVYVAQNVHIRILQNAGLPMNSWITNPIITSEVNFDAYVYDYFSP